MDSSILLLLAQADETLKAADKGVGTLERILQGGVPLICLVIAVVCGVFAYWQLRRNNTIEKEWREGQKKDADAALAAQAKAAEDNKNEQKALMREMLQRDRDALEAQNACAVALAGVTDTMKDIAAGDAAALAALRPLDASIRAILDKSTSIEARITAMESRLASIDTRTHDTERKVRDTLDVVERGPRRPT